MVKKKIFTVGFELPGEEFEYIPFDSDQSLLDADIILFMPGYGESYASEHYQGEPLFSPSASVKVSQVLQHWRNELTAAINAGKLVIVFLTKPKKFYQYTGDKQYSGTGRSRVTTNMVAQITSYSAVPNIVSVEAKTGREVKLCKEGAYLASYWKEFEAFSPYQVFLNGKFTHNIITTKSGDKTVAAAVHGKGTILFLPPLSYDEKKFLKYNAKSNQTFWTTEAIQFGKRLLGTLVALSDSFSKGRANSPPPGWVLDSAFRTDEEDVYQKEIAKKTSEISKLQQEKTELEQRLNDVGAIRWLLYEQGKPLESAVREALTIFGFSAIPFAESDSEFDVVFESSEGRCLGEVEGKDNKAISIEKFSQLERNLQEDFSRDGVLEYAKGVLFGNAERLKLPSERGDTFTAKCITAADRVGAALVNTCDLFEPARYLRTQNDPKYAKECREAIFQTKGGIVTFPPPPLGTTTEILKNVE